MNETLIARLFKNGASQAVRLPAQFRFQGSEVYATRDENTGDVVLSNQPGAKAWNEFFELLSAVMNQVDPNSIDRDSNTSAIVSPGNCGCEK
jgi:antitoxin VapB